MAKRRRRFYILAGVFSLISAVVNGISPIAAKSGAPLCAAGLCAAAVLAATGAASFKIASDLKNSKENKTLTGKVIPALFIALGVCIAFDAAVAAFSFSGLESALYIASDAVNIAGYTVCAVLMLKSDRASTPGRCALHIIFAVLAGSLGSVLLFAAYDDLPYDEKRDTARRRARNALIAVFFAVLIAEVVVSVFAPENMAEVFSELYIRACMLIFISFVSLYAFIPDAKYRERTPASDPFKAAAKSKSTAAVDELMKYKGQLDRGEITREEFEKKKSELMK